MFEQKTLTEMTTEIVSTFKAYEQIGTNPWTYETAVQDLPYQIGKLSKAILQLKGDRYAEGMNVAQIKEQAADELADILAEVLFMAHGLGIDMYEAWNNMLKSDKNKIAEYRQ